MLTIARFFQSINAWIARKPLVSLRQNDESFKEDAAAAVEALAQLHRIAQERLAQALPIQQAVARGAPVAEVRALQQKYLEACERWDAELKPLLEALSDPETGVNPLLDDPSCVGQLTEASLVNWLRRRRRLNAAAKLWGCAPLLPLSERRPAHDPTPSPPTNTSVP
jgi:hypothetical protein